MVNTKCSANFAKNVCIHYRFSGLLQIFELIQLTLGQLYFTVRPGFSLLKKFETIHVDFFVDFPKKNHNFFG